MDCSDYPIQFLSISGYPTTYQHHYREKPQKNGSREEKKNVKRKMLKSLGFLWHTQGILLWRIMHITLRHIVKKKILWAILYFIEKTYMARGGICVRRITVFVWNENRRRKKKIWAQKYVIKLFTENFQFCRFATFKIRKEEKKTLY